MMRVVIALLLVVASLVLTQAGLLDNIKNEIGKIGKDIEDGINKLVGNNGNQSDSIFGHITGDDRVHLLTDVKTADIYLNVDQLLAKNGYPVESYVVRTEDGYLITLHRIPKQSKKVVILFRALFCNTYQYLFLGPQKALAYGLADRGYDVWMVEMRGNSYSKAHVKLQPSKEDFWNMSWDEMGRYDVPAAINYVQNKTGVEKMFVAGHSMGNTALFVAAAVHPELNDKIRLLVALGPTTFTSHISGPMGVVGKLIPQAAMQLIPYQSFVPLTVQDLLKFLGKTVCGVQVSAVACTGLISIFDGSDFGNLNSTSLPSLIYHIPESDSDKNIMHYLQGLKSGKFQQYDYGVVGNTKRYGKAQPPEYDLSNVKAPVALFASYGDWFAGEKNVELLRQRLPNVALAMFTEDRSFTHIDFAFGNNAPDQVYKHMYKIMDKY